MNYRGKVRTVEARLQRVAQKELDKSHHDTATNPVLRTSPQEPDFMARLAVKTMSDIASRWSGVLQQIGVKISVLSVFCHQKPIVEYTDTSSVKRPEIGDLLVVHFHHPKRGRIARRAILYQAKVASQFPVTISPNDMKQFNLYATWPDFNYYRPKLGVTRRVTPKAPHSGAKYLFIKRPGSAFTSTFIASNVSMYPVFHTGVDLSKDLTNILLLRAGRVFHDKDTTLGQSDWSAMVWDLLRLASKSVFKRKNSGYSNQSRLSGPSGIIQNTLFLTIHDIGSNGSSSGEDNQQHDSDDEMESVSVIAIETWDSKSDVQESVQARVENIWTKVKELKERTLKTVRNREFVVKEVTDTACLLLIKSSDKTRTLSRHEIESAGLLPREHWNPSTIRKTGISEFSSTYVAAILRSIF